LRAGKSGRGERWPCEASLECALYSLTKGQAAIRDWFRATQDRTGNLPLFPGIFPDQMAPIVRAGSNSERELVMVRWGMPGPPSYGGAPVSGPHWRGSLGPVWNFACRVRNKTIRVLFHERDLASERGSLVGARRRAG
jgi:hypothetical protein